MVRRKGCRAIILVVSCNQKNISVLTSKPPTTLFTRESTGWLVPHCSVQISSSPFGQSWIPWNENTYELRCSQAARSRDEYRCRRKKYDHTGVFVTEIPFQYGTVTERAIFPLGSMQRVPVSISLSLTIAHLIRLGAFGFVRWTREIFLTTSHSCQ